MISLNPSTQIWNVHFYDDRIRRAKIVLIKLATNYYQNYENVFSSFMKP